MPELGQLSVFGGNVRDNNLLDSFSTGWNTTWYQAGIVLFECQTMLDHVLLTVALDSLRQAMRRRFCCSPNCRQTFLVTRQAPPA
ncbi:hypothetical protein BV898_15919 [Hypsibius exemplaris]|uniref:Uncharacterized protein n=1 Tax=Hypsibius exemplaris TaxID=2072580 RepID=A0A9X6RKP5_HYPEX|nr:hypothetical protein BV898_15919 [Hypsibius exemplaris]